MQGTHGVPKACSRDLWVFGTPSRGAPRVRRCERSSPECAKNSCNSMSTTFNLYSHIDYVNREAGTCKSDLHGKNLGGGSNERCQLCGGSDDSRHLVVFCWACVPGCLLVDRVSGPFARKCSLSNLYP